MTEIEILEIHFQGSEVNLKVGDRIFLREPHFFITEETPQLLKEYGKNSVISIGSSYQPMEKEKVYLVYGHYVDNLDLPEIAVYANFKENLVSESYADSLNALDIAVFIENGL